MTKMATMPIVWPKPLQLKDHKSDTAKSLLIIDWPKSLRICKEKGLGDSKKAHYAILKIFFIFVQVTSLSIP